MRSHLRTRTRNSSKLRAELGRRIDKLRMSYGPAWPNLKQAVKGMKEIIELAKAGQLPPLDEPPPN